MDYSETLSRHRLALETRHSKNDPLTPTDIFKGIDFEQDNRPLFVWGKSAKLISDKDIRHARHCDTITKALGAFPNSAVEFIEILVKRLDVAVTYNGLMSRIDMMTGRRTDIIITDFARDARITAASLKLAIGREEINDAVDAWYSKARPARLACIVADLEPRAEFDWLAVARNCFDCSTSSPEYIAALLKKFIHQTQCKIHGVTVEHHLMVVILGRQGTGKSYFVRHLLASVAELARNADFRMIADERNIELWSSYVLFLDEMAHGARSDIETVKNVITADMLDRRPMRTNAILPVRQHATLIGCANKDLSEIIKDETGARRFAAIEYSPPADRNFISSLDWRAAWRSVKHTDPDPMDEFRSQLQAAQEEDRHLSPVDEWLRQLTPVGCTNPALCGATMTPLDLYADYLSFRSLVTGDRDPTPRTFQMWAKEANRFVRQFPELYAIKRGRSGSGIVWQWIGDVKFTVLDGGMK